KIAATLSSTGTPALYLHPVEALHGDLGMVVRGDVVLALSASGETEEILALLATIKRLRVPLIAMTGDEMTTVARAPLRQAQGKLSPAKAGSSKGLSGARKSAGKSSADRPELRAKAESKSAGEGGRSIRTSTLASAADIALDCSIAEEACSLGLAPTASTTTMLALGDALAVALSEKRGFKEEDCASLHPGGKLGKKLARVESLMHAGNAIPRVAPTTRMSDVIYEMSRKKLGMTTVVEGETLLGVISDGDLRRLLERRGKDVLDLTAGECMTGEPKTISTNEFAAT